MGWLKKSENITGKFWITPNGDYVDITGDTHQSTAWNIALEKYKKRFEPTAEGQNEAEEFLKSKGWIRGQIYLADGLAMEGSKSALNSNAINALLNVPNPRRIYISVWPKGVVQMFTLEEIEQFGWDRVAKLKLKKKAYANTFTGVIQEFRRFAVDETKAQDFLSDLTTSWYAIPGPNGEYYEVDSRTWNKVMEHISAKYPNVPCPSWFYSIAHKSALAGQDPHGRKFDKR